MRTQTFILSLLLLAFPLPGRCEVANLSNEQMEQYLARGVPVIDIRTAGEWKQTGVIKGSRLITFFDEAGRANPEAWMAQLSKIAGPKDPVVIVCRSGHRSARVAQFLDGQAGYRKVAHLERGISNWIGAGKPVVKP